MSKKKRKHLNPEQKNCYYCEHCIYLGEGGYMCGMNNDIVIEDWQPTEDFNSCKGKEFVSI
jgi:hypothetical protein